MAAVFNAEDINIPFLRNYLRYFDDFCFKIYVLKLKEPISMHNRSLIVKKLLVSCIFDDFHKLIGGKSHTSWTVLWSISVFDSLNVCLVDQQSNTKLF